MYKFSKEHQAILEDFKKHSEQMEAICKKQGISVDEAIAEWEMRTNPDPAPKTSENSTSSTSTQEVNLNDIIGDD